MFVSTIQRLVSLPLPPLLYVPGLLLQEALLQDDVLRDHLHLNPIKYNHLAMNLLNAPPTARGTLPTCFMSLFNASWMACSTSPQWASLATMAAKA
jgi:hypothetical protein